MSDLISRNDAAVAACDACNRMFGEEPCWDSECLMKRRIDEVIAIDAKPVVHGEWISMPHKSARVCSRCESDEPYKNAPDDADVFYYCPNCGARMDGGKEDADYDCEELGKLRHEIDRLRHGKERLMDNLKAVLEEREENS